MALNIRQHHEKSNNAPSCGISSTHTPNSDRQEPWGSTKQEINYDVWYAKHVPRATLGPPSFYSASALSRDFERVVHTSCMALWVGVLFPPGALNNFQVTVRSFLL